jgi:hypothetical protein
MLRSSERTGPDGLVAYFYHKNWAVVREEVCSVVPSNLISGVTKKDLNSSYIALIPKVNNPLE